MIDRNIEFKIGEKQRGLRLGNYAFMMACQKAGISDMNKLFEKIKEGDLLVITCYLYGAAVQYTKHKHQEVDFNEVDVSEWFEELGLEKGREIMAELLKSYVSKNQQPPETEGAK